MTWNKLQSTLKVLLVLALLPLAGCSAWRAGGVQVQPLPNEVADPCPHPMDVIRTVSGSTVGSDEIRMGRLGDALLECGQEKDIVVEGYQELSDLLR